MKYEQTVLHLSLILGVGPATIKLILENVENLINVYNFFVADFVKIGLSFDRAQKVVAGLQDRSLLDKELALIAKHQISWCVLGTEEY